MSIIEELEAEPTLRHLAWHAATVLAPNHGLEIGGEKWGEQEDGERQGNSEASAYFAVAIHKDVRKMDESVSASGGAALFGNDDGYIVAPPNEAKAALRTFKESMRIRCGLHLQEEKTELYSLGVLDDLELDGMKRAGVQTASGSMLHLLWNSGGKLCLRQPHAAREGAGGGDGGGGGHQHP